MVTGRPEFMLAPSCGDFSFPPLDLPPFCFEALTSFLFFPYLKYSRDLKASPAGRFLGVFRMFSLRPRCLLSQSMTPSPPSFPVA